MTAVNNYFAIGQVPLEQDPVEQGAEATGLDSFLLVL